MSYRLSSSSATDGLKLSAQEHLLPGETLQEKFQAATALGYQGIEVRSAGDFQFAAREAQLAAAVRDGVVISSACMDMRCFIGDFDPDRRKEARENLKSQLGVIARLGGAGVIAPATYGVASKRLPPYATPRSAQEDAEIVIKALAELGQVAEQEGTYLLLEPLNRYEDFILNTLAQGADFITAAGTPGVRLCADFYHMNIEEADVAASLLAASDHLGIIHLSDSNRHEPGAGHVDWLAGLAALEAAGYDGWMTLECRPSTSDPRLVLASCRDTVARAHAAVASPRRPA